MRYTRYLSTKIEKKEARKCQERDVSDSNISYITCFGNNKALLHSHKYIY